jgi:hypothetical protein
MECRANLKAGESDESLAVPAQSHQFQLPPIATAGQHTQQAIVPPDPTSLRDALLMRMLESVIPSPPPQPAPEQQQRKVSKGESHSEDTRSESQSFSYFRQKISGKIHGAKKGEEARP